MAKFPKNIYSLCSIQHGHRQSNGISPMFRGTQAENGGACFKNSPNGDNAFEFSSELTNVSREECQNHLMELGPEKNPTRANGIIGNWCEMDYFKPLTQAQQAAHNIHNGRYNRCTNDGHLIYKKKSSCNIF